MRDNIKGGALTEVTFFVLLSVYQPKHGYAIMQFIEEKTNGRLVLGAGYTVRSHLLKKRDGSYRAVMQVDEKKSILLQMQEKKSAKKKLFD